MGGGAIRRAAAGDREAVLACVSEAFAQDPAWAFILGGEYERLATDFAAALFDVRLASQTVWVSDDVATVSMWDPPGGSPAPSGHARSVWARYRALAGEEAFERLVSYNEAVAACKPADSHWYLGVLATHPRRRREGLASAVLAPVLEGADRLGLACCLETSTAQNRRFYEGRGFTQATDVALAGGPPTWWLRRPPPR